MKTIFERFRESAANLRKDLAKLSKSQKPSVCVRLSIKDFEMFEEELKEIPTDVTASLPYEGNDPNIIILTIYGVQFAIFKENENR